MRTEHMEFMNGSNQKSKNFMPPQRTLKYSNAQILTIEIAIKLHISELLEIHKGTVFWKGKSAI